MDNTNQYYNNQQVPPVPPVSPGAMLKTNRSLGKYVLLSLITFGIYGLVCMGGMAHDLQYVAFKNDGKKQMNFYLMALLLGPITGGIVTLIWFHNFSNRIGDELKRRNIDYSVSASDFWLWNVLGSMIIAGPFIYMNKVIKGMNLICEDYNRRGF